MTRLSWVGFTCESDPKLPLWDGSRNSVKGWIAMDNGIERIITVYYEKLKSVWASFESTLIGLGLGLGLMFLKTLKVFWRTFIDLPEMVSYVLRRLKTVVSVFQNHFQTIWRVGGSYSRLLHQRRKICRLERKFKWVDRPLWKDWPTRC